MDKLTVGKTYNITHCRKGSFTIKVTELNGEWATGLITKGHTTTLLSENQRVEGEKQPMRIRFLTKIEEVK